MEQRLIGTTMPVIEFILEPGESIQARSGELAWKSESTQMRTGAQMAGAQGFGGLAKRVLGGGSLFMTEYYADTQRGLVAFAAKIPGQIMPLDLNGNDYLVHRGGLVCGTPGVEVSVGLQRSIGAGLFGGTGFVLQRLGGNGRAWIELGGEVVTYDLDPGEVLHIHPGHAGLFEGSVSVGLTRVTGIKNMLFGGDGLVLVTLTGPGKIWLQSMPLPELAGALAPYLPNGGQDSSSPLTHAAVDPVGAVGAAAIGTGVSALGGGDDSSSAGQDGPLNALAESAPVAPSGEDRAFLPNGGAPIASDPIPTPDAPDLSGIAGAAPDLSGVADAASSALGGAMDAVSSGGGGFLGSLFGAVGNILSNSTGSSDDS